MNELEELYKEIQPKIYAFFYVKTFDRASAEDLTHDVFYEAVKGFSSFSGKSTLQTWIFSIAKNLLKKHYRSKKYVENLKDQLAADEATPPLSPEDLYMLKEGNEKLLQQISRLDDLSREIVTLRIYGELSFQEIGQLVDKTENYVRVNFHRSKLRLQKEMRVNDE
ncbi:RNA polymerase sigma factor [Lederbergia citrea]|uniref:RNA polymerase sigma factor n=1 Tax=Lederbergia citrea TaxID=2833581 RepID=UPI001BCA47E9|nr:sigma-70 family RNA polymerase sigma factor [Lederbergia citrea]MBS4177914.1 sigma-70 family RNA polymerase sigma factor [Lederbergia citrea]